jgi:hypothetical protein
MRFQRSEEANAKGLKGNKKAAYINVKVKNFTQS